MADLDNPALEQPPSTTIETERLRLRTVTMGDVEALMPIITNPETMRMARGVVTGGRAAAEQWLSARALGKDVFNFLITLKPPQHTAGMDSGADEVVVGIMGSFHWPEVGYLMNAQHAGKGYATEALQSFVPAFFARVPPAHTGSEGIVGATGTGFDYIEGRTDSENHASQRVLQKCGFMYIETLGDGFDSPTLGLRDVKVFRRAREGRTLEELGLIPSAPEGGKDEEEGFVPPIQ